MDLRVTAKALGACVCLVISGDLSIESAAYLRRIMRKCLAEQPEAIIADVTAMTVSARAPLTVFPTVLSLQEPPGVPIFLACPSEDVRSQAAGGVLGQVAMFADVSQAVEAASSLPATRRVKATLGPTAASAAKARKLVADACRRWQVAHVAEHAQLVISELVTNAVVHARTPMRVTASLRGAYLYLNVHDQRSESPCAAKADELPQRSHRCAGRGLYFVDLCSTSWGTVHDATGKTVWASIRAVPAELDPDTWAT